VNGGLAVEPGGFERARDFAYRLLSYRGRSEAELTQRLQSKEFEPSVVKDVLDHLRAYGYIDDLSLAREWVRQRLAHRPAGRILLIHELRRKGIDAGDVELALNSFGRDEELATALALARKKIQRHGPGYRDKLPMFLQRRGFAISTVRQVCHIVDSTTHVDHAELTHDF